MQFALCSNVRTPPSPGLRGNCPLCGAALLAKCGELVTWHWSHFADPDCDPWSEGESAWHAEWKTAAPPGRREVVMPPHRADVVAGDGTVCEIQRAGISAAEIREREAFYAAAGSRPHGLPAMRWIFDASDKEYEWNPLQDGEDEPFRWKIHRRAPWPTIGACRMRVMLDFGDMGVLSCEQINASGTYAWGYLYPRETIRRWIAGPGYDPSSSAPSVL